MIKQIVTTVVLVFAIVLAGFGQRYGHLNFGNLLSIMPATAEADSQLVKYRSVLVKQGEAMAEQFQLDYDALVKDIQGGILTPVEQQTREQALQQQQQKIQEFRVELDQKLATRRQDLIRPIVTQAEAAIATVAEANGFEMIFDTSVFNAILFAQDSENVFELVAEELGLEIPETTENE